MKRILIETRCKKLLADVYTLVGIYLRLRDRFRDTVLLESADFNTADNSYSFIGVNAIAGIEIIDRSVLELKFPGKQAEKIRVTDPMQVPALVWEFMNRFEAEKPEGKEGVFAQGLFGYTSYDAVQFFETIQLKAPLASHHNAIPLMRYRFYQYVIAINHFRDELFICENIVAGIESELETLESLIRSRDVPVYPFSSKGEEVPNLADEEYLDMVKKGIQ